MIRQMEDGKALTALQEQAAAEAGIDVGWLKSWNSGELAGPRA